jgi:hypothetical protein
MDRIGKPDFGSENILFFPSHERPCWKALAARSADSQGQVVGTGQGTLEASQGSGPSDAVVVRSLVCPWTPEAQRFQAEAHKLGCRVELVIHQGGGHGWWSMIWGIRRFSDWFDQHPRQ